MARVPIHEWIVIDINNTYDAFAIGRLDDDAAQVKMAWICDLLAHTKFGKDHDKILDALDRLTSRMAVNPDWGLVTKARLSLMEGMAEAAAKAEKKAEDEVIADT